MLLLGNRHLARILRVGGLDPQVLHEGVGLGLTHGLVLLVLECGEQRELFAAAREGVGLYARCWSFV